MDKVGLSQFPEGLDEALLADPEAAAELIESEGSRGVPDFGKDFLGEARLLRREILLLLLIDDDLEVGLRQRDEGQGDWIWGWG